MTAFPLDRPAANDHITVIRDLGLLDTPSEEDFDRITRTASAALRTPISVITFIDADRQFFLSCVGLPEPFASERESPLSHSFCRHVVASAEPLMVADAREHPLVRDNPAIADFGVLAYAGAPLRLRSGEVIGALSVFDSEPRRWTEQELWVLSDLAGWVVERIEWRQMRKREAHYRALSEAASDGILTIDQESTILFANPAAHRLFGYEEEDLVGEPLATLIPERLQVAHHHALGRYLETGERGTSWTGIELPGRTKTGEEIAVEISFGESFADGKRIFTGIVRDVGRRIGAEQALRQREKRYQALVAATAQIVWVTTPEGTLTGEQPGWSAFTQTPEEYEGWGWLDAIHSEDRERTAEAWAEAVRNRSPYSLSHRVRRHDGEFFHFAVRGVPVLEHDGSVREWIGAHTDISRQVRAEEEREFLVGASELLASSLDYERTLANVTRLAVQELADWCAVDILRDGRIERVAAAHRDRTKDDLARQLQRYPFAADAPGGAPRVIRTGQSILYPDVPDGLLRAVARGPEHLELLRTLGLRSGMVVPLVGSGAVIGAITMVSTQSGRSYSPADLELAEDLARRASIAIDNARLLREAGTARDMLEQQALELESQMEELQNQATRLEENRAELEIVNAELHQANAALELEARERARAQTRLRDSELSYRSLWDSLSDLAYILDLDGNLLNVNQAVLHRYGYDAEEILGLSPAVLAAHEFTDPDQTRARVQRASEGEPQRFEVLARTKAGEVFPKEVILSRGEYFGAPVVIAVGRDISKQKAAARMLRESEERFRQLAENLDVVFWMFDHGEQRTVYVSPRVEAVWGMTAEALYADPQAWMKRLHPDDRTRVLATLEASREGDYEIEYRIVRPGGEIRWVRDRGFPIRNESGEIYRTGGVAEDITDERHAREALRDSEEKFRQIAEHVQELFWIFGPNFEEAIYVNSAYETLWGRSVESVYREPQSFLEAVHPEDLGQLRSAMEAVMHSPFDGVEYRIVKPDGTIRWMFSRGFPVVDERGKVTRIVGTTADVTRHKQAELAIRQSEERFRTLFEQSSAGVLIHDARGRILQVNEGLCASLGYTRTELVGAQVADIEVGIGERELLEAWGRVHRNASQMVPGVWRRKDGGTFPVEAWLRRIELQGQSLILVEAHDVTERKMAEAQLESAEAHYRRLVETAPQAIYALDGEGRFIELNPAGERLLGCAAADLLGRHFSSVIVPADLQVAEDGFNRVMSGAEYSIEFEQRIRCSSGEDILVHVTETAIYDGEEIVGTHGIARDITEERAQVAQMRLLTSSLEGLKEGVSVSKSDGELIYANTTHARLLGYNPDTGELPNASRFIPDEEEAQRLEEIFREVADNGTWVGTVRRRRLDDGRIIPLEMIAGRVDQNEGSSVLFNIVRDITEEIQREKQLRRVERLASVGTLIGGVAHELNNPLQAILNFSELMLMDERDGEDREALEIVRREADRAAKVVSDLRLVARDTQGEKSGREAVDLNEAIEHVLKIRRYALETSNVEIRKDLSDDLPPVLANRGEIEQVILNLVVNAEQAMMDGRAVARLIIRTRRTPTGAAAHIVDNGSGVSPENLERIFDPFFTTKPPGEGTGLGLSLVHSIVTEHGGEIHVDSEVGKGTAFRIHLPRAASAPEDLQVPVVSAAPVRRLRVLVVDDEAAVRTATKRFLERLGHQADVASDGGIALRLLEQEHYDVIVSDLRMPGIDGEALFRRLREQGGGLDRRVIFLTGDAANPKAFRALADARVPVLIKPVRLGDLAKAVDRVAGHPDTDRSVDRRS